VKLPEQSIVQWFAKPFRRWRWTPPLVPDFAGPADLANLLRSHRTRLAEIRAEGGRPDVTLGDLPDAALEPLLTVAYRASFLTEEGRPVRACLYAPSRCEIEPEDPGISDALRELVQQIARHAREGREAATNTYCLANALPLDDPKHIARFAPTLAAEDAVLTVREAGGQLVCGGIALLDSRDATNSLLSMPRGWSGVGGLFVQILGPGELRVSEGRLEYTLRANMVRVYMPVSFTKPVRQWHEELAKGLIASCSRHQDWNEKHIGEPVSEDALIDLMILWSRILQEAARMRHGGAFAVVPDVAAAPVTMKYPLQPFDLGGELREAWLSLCRAWTSVKGRDEWVVDRLEEKRCRIHKLCSAARSVGHLSGTDGCVVLDRNLIVHGFGGSIRVDEAPPKRCIRVTGETRADIDESSLLLPFGERHKSAFKLCKKLPGSMVFVISQDGDLRIFESDESAVYLHDLLYP